MAKEILKTTINISDHIVIRGFVWRCERRTMNDCTRECGMFSKDTGRCLGTCFRYQRDDVVFSKCCLEKDYPTNGVVFRTPYLERYEDALYAIRIKQKTAKP